MHTITITQVIQITPSILYWANKIYHIVYIIIMYSDSIVPLHVSMLLKYLHLWLPGYADLNYQECKIMLFTAPVDNSSMAVALSLLRM